MGGPHPPAGLLVGGGLKAKPPSATEGGCFHAHVLPRGFPRGFAWLQGARRPVAGPVRGLRPQGQGSGRVGLEQDSCDGKGPKGIPFILLLRGPGPPGPLPEGCLSFCPGLSLPGQRFSPGRRGGESPPKWHRGPALVEARAVSRSALS